MDGRIETQALFGEPVRILAQRGSWTQVAVTDQPTPKDRLGYPGWVPTRQLTASPTFGGGCPRRIARSATSTRVAARRRPPSSSSASERACPRSGTSGSEVEVATPTGAIGGCRLGRSRLRVGRRDPDSDRRQQLVATARLFLGVRYLWGGTSAFGFDCSGLVNLIYRVNGIVIPRDADAQALAGRPVARERSSLVTWCSSRPIRPRGRSRTWGCTSAAGR